MMADDVSRAVGAGSTETITIAGKECTVRPLTLRELGEIERDCLKRYKRQYLSTYSENVDLLEGNEATKLMEHKLEEVARWDISSLPLKYVYDPNRLNMNESLKKWAVDNLAIDTMDKDGKEISKSILDKVLKSNVATALDNQSLTDELYENLTGDAPRKMKVPYVNWWITGTFEGMITMMWQCFKRNNVTREEVEEAIADNPGMLAQISREIEHLSSPAVGNG
jgi:hypothetical protein